MSPSIRQFFSYACTSTKCANKEKAEGRYKGEKVAIAEYKENIENKKISPPRTESLHEWYMNLPVSLKYFLVHFPKIEDWIKTHCWTRVETNILIRSKFKPIE